MQNVESFDRKTLIEKLIWNRQPPIFDNQIIAFQNIINNHNQCDPLTTQEKFVKSFDKWIHNTKNNKISGLDKLPHKDFCVGTTGYMDDIYVVHGPNVRYLDMEYSYHWRLNIGKKVMDFKELTEGDHLIISAPFSFYGDKHPDMERILDHCDGNNVVVHVDSAWYGCVRDFELNYDRKCIQSAGFSLSKGLSCGHNRIGIRYSKIREPGPITISNDFNMGVCHLMVLGMELMKKFNCDFLQDKYCEVYKQLCDYLALTPSKSIHVAFTPHPESQALVPIGVSNILKSLIS